MPDHIKKQLQKEIEILEHELAHELPAEIKKAAALGDLSENAEYHMAKQRQTFVNARLGHFKKRMAELSLVNLANIPRDKTGFGSTVVVFDSTKNEEIVLSPRNQRGVRCFQGAHLHHFAHRPRPGRQARRGYSHNRDAQRQTRTRDSQLTTIHDEAAENEADKGEAASAGQ